ncbi:4-hydroxyphenylpyruvate dioxygenase [Streptomyces carpaticus]|uniref:4-hydroxyphenylpyruvate dioxygenase n=1 Tax=Streptomyces TaxID=1883 RepID=UPI00220CAE24|nr:4-hydroxyphenylpyruvate dioxygenase [Streptomyces carpaticus]
MPAPCDPQALPDLTVGHLGLYVADRDAVAAEFTEGYGFRPVPPPVPPDDGARSVWLRQGEAVLVLTEPGSARHPGHAFLEAHGDGVADIALRVPDARAAFDTALARGARPAGPAGQEWAVEAFGGVRHSFVETGPAAGGPPAPGGRGIETVDHLAVCLPAGELAPTVAHYETVFGLTMVFEERISVGRQAMLSQVVQSRSAGLTLTLIQPDTTGEPGQIDRFLDRNGGAGVQHVAFSTPDAVRTVTELMAGGVEFLGTPDTYYQQLGSRISVSAHTVRDLQRVGLLVDEDQDGQLFQIFTRSTHPRNTLFYEVIERLGARTFGSGNIAALYRAVEAERARAGAPR